jgi:catechol 2,3-dioxygenase-like lactoylglutathione lyase family enzyme
MTLALANITIDCGDVAAVSGFWSGVLGLPVDHANEYVAMINRDEVNGPTWLFIQVPEGKAAKNRMHVDFRTDDREAEVDRVLRLGATRQGDHDEFGVRWTVLADPEGNEFCIGQPNAG